MSKLRTSASAIALVALLGLATAPLPAAGFHNPGLPVLDEFAIAASSYAAWRVSLPSGGTVDVEGIGSGSGTTYSVGVWILAGDASLLGAIVFTGWSNGATQLHVDLPDPVGNILERHEGGMGAGLGLAATSTLGAGEYIFVATQVSDGPMNGNFVLSGSGATVVAKTTGAGFLYREPDFDGLLNVYANVPTPRGTLLVKAIEDTSVAQPVAGKLFMLFQGFSNTQDLLMSYDGPGGHTDIPCGSAGSFCIATAFLHGVAPGAYSLNIDHSLDYYSNINPLLCPGCFSPAIFASGADVTLP